MKTFDVFVAVDIDARGPEVIDRLARGGKAHPSLTSKDWRRLGRVHAPTRWEANRIAWHTYTRQIEWRFYKLVERK